MTAEHHSTQRKEERLADALATRSKKVRRRPKRSEAVSQHHEREQRETAGR